MGKIYGIGVDAVSVDRLIQKRMTSHIVRRMFHPEEVEQAGNLEDPRRAEFLASRFAAKEAFAKALGVGFTKVRPSDVCVRCDAAGKPMLYIFGNTAHDEVLEHLDIHLSLTHEASMAIAFVVLEYREGCC